jgi:hypothetical protein
MKMFKVPGMPAWLNYVITCAFFVAIGFELVSMYPAFHFISFLSGYCLAIFLREWAEKEVRP